MDVLGTGILSGPGLWYIVKSTGVIRRLLGEPHDPWNRDTADPCPLSRHRNWLNQAAHSRYLYMSMVSSYKPLQLQF